MMKDGCVIRTVPRRNIVNQIVNADPRRDSQATMMVDASSIRAFYLGRSKAKLENRRISVGPNARILRGNNRLAQQNTGVVPENSRVLRVNSRRARARAGQPP